MKKKRKKNHSTFDAIMLFMFLSLGAVDWDKTPLIFSATWLIILCFLVVIRRVYDEFS